jgi:hypothetical protein
MFIITHWVIIIGGGYSIVALAPQWGAGPWLAAAAQPSARRFFCLPLEAGAWEKTAVAAAGGIPSTAPPHAPADFASEEVSVAHGCAGFRLSSPRRAGVVRNEWRGDLDNPHLFIPGKGE